jgi:hypothetical protein
MKINKRKAWVCLYLVTGRAMETMSHSWKPCCRMPFRPLTISDKFTCTGDTSAVDGRDRHPQKHYQFRSIACVNRYGPSIRRIDRGPGAFTTNRTQRLFHALMAR